MERSGGDRNTFLVPDHVPVYVLFLEPSCRRVAVAEMDVILGGQPPSYSNSRNPGF